MTSRKPDIFWTLSTYTSLHRPRPAAAKLFGLRVTFLRSLRRRVAFFVNSWRLCKHALGAQKRAVKQLGSTLIASKAEGSNVDAFSRLVFSLLSHSSSTAKQTHKVKRRLSCREFITSSHHFGITRRIITSRKQRMSSTLPWTCMVTTSKPHWDKVSKTLALKNHVLENVSC